MKTENIKAFVRSPHHAWLTLLTVGVGVATLTPVGMVAGAAAYLLGWIYLPGSKWFGRRLASKAGEDGKEVREFLARRRAMYDGLPAEARARYDSLAARIEENLAELARGEGLNKVAVEERSQRLATLGWTYLRLLSTEEASNRFLASEAPEELESEIRNLEESIAALDPAERPRLADSKQARLDSLKARAQKRSEAEASRDLVCAEQERIIDLVKLMHADLLSDRNSGALSGEIAGTEYFLDVTADWLRDSEFDSSPSDVSESVTGAVPLSISQ